MNIIVIIIAASFLVCGCAKIQYLDEALRLKGYAEETTAQKQQVAAQDAAFDRLWSRIIAGDALADLKTGRVVRHLYGEPVVIAPSADRPGCVQWLYRYQVKYFNSPKVYFLLDAGDRIISIRTEHAR